MTPPSTPPRQRVVFSMIDEPTPIGALMSSKKSLFGGGALASATSDENPGSSEDRDRDLSLRDVQALFRSDTHPLKEKITSDPDKFFQVLQSIKLRRGQFVGWAPATYYKRSERHSDGTTTDTRVDILVDLHALTTQQVREVAGLVWRDSNARSLALDGTSPVYARRAFATFLFSSMEPTLESAIQQAIQDSMLWADGPLVWMTLVNHLFPSSGVLRNKIRTSLEKLTLKSVEDHVPTFTTRYRETLPIVTEDNGVIPDTVYDAFFRQMMTHPLQWLRTHFTWSLDQAHSFRQRCVLISRIHRTR